MKRQKMLIIIVTITAICMMGAAGFMYLLAHDFEQPAMRTAAKQGTVFAAADKITVANKPAAKTLNNSSSNMSAFEKTVQEFREKTASSRHVNDDGTSPSPANSGEAVPAEQNKGDEQRWNTASTEQVSMQARDGSSVPANSAFVSRAASRDQIREADPSPGPADDSRNRDESTTSGGIPDSEEGDSSSQSVLVSRFLSEGSGKGEIKVTLSISLSGVRPNGLIVKENIPKGWEVSDSTLPYRNYDPSTGEIKWLLMGNDLRSMEIGYRVVKKETAATETAFHGNYLYNDANGQRVTMQINGV